MAAVLVFTRNQWFSLQQQCHLPGVTCVLELEL